MLFSIPPLFWAFATAIGIAGWSLFSRLMMKGEKDYLAVAAVNEGLSSLLLLAIIAIFGVGWLFSGPLDFANIPAIGWLVLAVSTILYTASGILAYRIFQHIDASERAVVTQIQIVWAVLLGIVLLGERPGPDKMLAAALVLGGALLCTYRPGHHRWKSFGVRLCALVALLYGTATLCDKVALAYFPPVLYALPMFVFPGVMALALLGKNARARMGAAWGKYRLKFAAFPLLSVLPYVTFLVALNGLPISVIIPITNTNVVLTSLGGMLLLNEREGWPQKIAGALLAFAGAWMIGGG